MDTTTVTGRVAAGAAWLDQRQPGWWQNINTATLQIHDECCCVLGQLYGGYADGAEAVGLLTEDSPGTIDLGFMWRIDEHYAPEDRGAEITALTAAWKQLIEARRAAQVQP